MKFRLLILSFLLLPSNIKANDRINNATEETPLIAIFKPYRDNTVTCCKAWVLFAAGMFAGGGIFTSNVPASPFSSPEPGQGCNYITMTRFHPLAPGVDYEAGEYTFGPTCDSYNDRSSIIKKCPPYVKFLESGQDKLMCQSWPPRCYSEKQVNDTFPKWCATIPQSSNIKRRHTKLMRLQREFMNNNSTAKRKTSAERKHAYQVGMRKNQEK